MHVTDKGQVTIPKHIRIAAGVAPVASLASYDGTAGTLVDTNVWIDCMDTSSRWHEHPCHGSAHHRRQLRLPSIGRMVV